VSRSPAPTRSTGRFLAILPLLAFLGLGGLFLAQLLDGRDIAAVPSALIGDPAPPTDLPPLAGLDRPGLTSRDFPGKVTVVNVWGSWCPPCREEHPILLELARDQRFTLAGLNYKDRPENARRFLEDLGNPFAAVGTDPAGRAAIDWGVYGAPETFVVGRDGTIRFKHVGPFTAESVRTVLMPAVDEALAESR